MHTSIKKEQNPKDGLKTKQLKSNAKPKLKNNSLKAQEHKAIQQKMNVDVSKAEIIQKKKNKTGLPDNLKSGIENLSGHAMDDVKVHYNSPKPAKVQAHAYAQGTDIHLASGQEKHLPHEAWHVAQQKQGRVKPTTTVAGMSVNDNLDLEKEADVMGAKATIVTKNTIQKKENTSFESSSFLIQRKLLHAEFGPIDPIGRGGTSVFAILGKGEDKNGNENTVAPPFYNNLTKSRGGTSLWSLGHLLNAKLGGDGTKLKNITPLSKSGNALHSARVEGPIKKEVEKLEGEEQIHYSVLVEYPTTPDPGAPSLFEGMVAKRLLTSWTKIGPLKDHPGYIGNLGEHKFKIDNIAGYKNFEPMNLDSDDLETYETEPGNEEAFYSENIDMSDVESAVHKWTENPIPLLEVEEMFRFMGDNVPGKKLISRGLEMVKNGTKGKSVMFRKKNISKDVINWVGFIKTQSLGYEKIAQGFSESGSNHLSQKYLAFSTLYSGLAIEMEKIARGRANHIIAKLSSDVEFYNRMYDSHIAYYGDDYESKYLKSIREKKTNKSSTKRRKK